MTIFSGRFVVPFLATLLLVPPAGAAATARAMPVPISTTDARTALAGLTVAKRGTLHGYSHIRFMPDWAPQRGACDTREIVLNRDGEAVRRDASCRVLAGTWYSRYDGELLTSEAELDVDHLVPLANAWRSGADAWTDAQRHAFANDLIRPELVTVSESANIDKGGSTPVTWRPPVTGYWCTYARSWITVKQHYALRITKAEKAALIEMLDTCSA
ncbi:HNH endonuclease family protein [Nonomuraea sp. NPDC050680]|uniref:HNH endonuclease family protein n=1 Tax=Nonomuraea sp. NPDC050680 TaxID=3154630 RepID=UPI0033EBE647